MVQDQFQRILKDVRISVTDKCNFRCPYCMPIDTYGDDYKFAPKATILTFEEMVRLAGLFIQLGAEKIRLTGGEPLLRKDLPELISQLTAIPGMTDLTLTTNGWFLKEKAGILKQAGLRRITVSLDSLDDAVFGKMNGRGYGVGPVLEGIEAAIGVGLTPVKVNVVVKRGENEQSLVPLAARLKSMGVIVRFIEYMDVGTLNGWRMDDVVPAAEIVEIIHQKMPLEPVEPNYRGEVALRYRYLDGTGEIGVIASISQPFCGDCTRARLSTSGELLTCLFAHSGVNLRDPLRMGASDKELSGLIAATWQRRTDRYSEQRSEQTPAPVKKLEMYQMGG